MKVALLFFFERGYRVGQPGLETVATEASGEIRVVSSVVTVRAAAETAQSEVETNAVGPEIGPVDPAIQLRIADALSRGDFARARELLAELLVKSRS